MFGSDQYLDRLGLRIPPAVPPEKIKQSGLFPGLEPGRSLADIATGGFGAVPRSFVVEKPEQRRPPASPRIPCIGQKARQSLPVRFGLCPAQRLFVLWPPQENRPGGQPVTPGPPRLLEVGFHRRRAVPVYHRAYVGLVNAHSIGAGTDQHPYKIPGTHFC